MLENLNYNQVEAHIEQHEEKLKELKTEIEK
jgi:hypothetical protein